MENPSWPSHLHLEPNDLDGTNFVEELVEEVVRQQDGYSQLIRYTGHKNINWATGDADSKEARTLAPWRTEEFPMEDSEGCVYSIWETRPLNVKETKNWELKQNPDAKDIELPLVHPHYFAMSDEEGAEAANFKEMGVTDFHDSDYGETSDDDAVGGSGDDSESETEEDLELDSGDEEIVAELEETRSVTMKEE